MVDGRTLLKEGHAGRWLGRALSWAGSQEAKWDWVLGVCNLLKDALRKKQVRGRWSWKVKKKSKQGCGLGQRLTLA